MVQTFRLSQLSVDTPDPPMNVDAGIPLEEMRFQDTFNGEQQHQQEDMQQRGPEHDFSTPRRSRT
eukprot:6793107-Karenia_brevis.AAC.1